MKEKPIVAIDLSSTGEGGGPYTSTKRIMNSGLKYKYEFKPFIYRTEIGRFISLKRIVDLKNQIESINPDLVHFTGLSLMGFHTTIACRLAGVKKSLVTIRGFSGDALDIGWIKRTILTFILEPITILLTKNNYGVSEFVSNRLMVKLFRKRNCGFIYNFPPESSKSLFDYSIRKELNLQTSDTIAVTVGRIVKDKGYHILDEAILRCSDIKDLKFIVIGQGTYLDQMKEKLKSLVKQRQVFFLGFRNDVQNILKGCNFFILPTLHESFSNALLEASYEGLPIIASNTGGVPEIVKNGYNGVLVQPGDINELYTAIVKLYKNNNMIKIYGENARKNIEEKFNANKIEAEIDRIYQKILKED